MPQSTLSNAALITGQLSSNLAIAVLIEPLLRISPWPLRLAELTNLSQSASAALKWIVLVRHSTHQKYHMIASISTAQIQTAPVWIDPLTH